MTNTDNQNRIKLKEAVIVEGRYDKIKLQSIVATTIIETNGFRVFSDKQKQELIRKIADKNGILILTDSDSAGFVIRNFLKGIVSEDKIKNCYIPDVFGKEKRKLAPSKEGKIGVEGIESDIIAKAIKSSGATILGEDSKTPSGALDKLSFYELGLCGGENSAILRKKALKALGFPEYLSTSAMITAVNCLYSYEEFLDILRKSCIIE